MLGGLNLIHPTLPQWGGRKADRRSRATAWSFIPLARWLLTSQPRCQHHTNLDCIVACGAPLGTSWLNANQLHRLKEFSSTSDFLVLFLVSEWASEWVSELLRSKNASISDSAGLAT